jgi:hypothetical protein
MIPLSTRAAPERAERRHGRSAKGRPWWPGQGERFLCGPLPWSWLTQAGRLPGCTLHVALRLWLEAGFHRTLRVSLNLTALAAEFNVDRATASRALHALVRERLVHVERRNGQKSMVTILVDAGPMALALPIGDGTHESGTNPPKHK